MNSIRIVVADDHEVVRRGLREVLQVAPGMKPVGEASDGSEAIRIVTEQEVDILILDLTMPGPSALDIVERLREVSPGTRVLVHTMHNKCGRLSRLLEAGAVGYVLKTSSLDGLLEAVRAVAGGRSWIDPVLAGQVIGRGRGVPEDDRSPSVLSPREEEVLRKIAWGYSNKRIGTVLGISTRTVETYKARIRSKLKLENRVQMVEYAVSQGWLSPEGDDL